MPSNSTRSPRRHVATAKLRACLTPGRTEQPRIPRHDGRISIVCMQTSLLNPQIPAFPAHFLYLQDASTSQFLECTYPENGPISRRKSLGIFQIDFSGFPQNIPRTPASSVSRRRAWGDRGGDSSCPGCLADATSGGLFGALSRNISFFGERRRQRSVHKDGVPDRSIQSRHSSRIPKGLGILSDAHLRNSCPRYRLPIRDRLDALRGPCRSCVARRCVGRKEVARRSRSSASERGHHRGRR